MPVPGEKDFEFQVTVRKHKSLGCAIIFFADRTATPKVNACCVSWFPKKYRGGNAGERVHPKGQCIFCKLVQSHVQTTNDFQNISWFWYHIVNEICITKIPAGSTPLLRI